MIRLDALALLVPDVAADELTAWIARRWVIPDQEEGQDLVFQEIDVARVRLIRDLLHDLALPEDVVPLILSLVDEIHELRGTLGGLGRALEAQPADVKRAVLSAFAAARRES